MNLILVGYFVMPSKTRKAAWENTHGFYATLHLQKGKQLCTPLLDGRKGPFIYSFKALEPASFLEGFTILPITTSRRQKALTKRGRNCASHRKKFPS